jgi:hypothetical protein
MLIDATQILAVRPDPDPGDLTAKASPQDAVAVGHTRRPDAVCGVHLLELEAWMGRITTEQTIRLVCFSLDFLRQVSE